MDHYLMTSIIITLWITVICFPGNTTTECPATVHTEIKGFGSACRYRCNCQNNEQCNEVTGVCSMGCSHGWMGPACQYRNYATAPTNSVSQNYNGEPESSYAINAIDGDVSTCSRTGGTEQHGQPTQQWWRAEFTSQLYILGLVIKIPESQKEKFRGFSVKIGNGKKLDLCYEHGIDVDGELSMTVNCVNPIVGSILEIKLAETAQPPLVLCEIEIFGGRLVSFNRHTSIESVLSYNGLWNSSYAVDGRQNLYSNENQNVQKSRTCTATRDAEPNVLKWWDVDLGNVYSIQGISFFGRLDMPGTGQFKSYSVLVRESQTQQFDIIFEDSVDGNSYHPKSANYTNPHPGRIVRIQRADKILVICEFEVFGECPLGKCGLECDETCMCSSQTTGMHKIEGICPYGCTGRWNGPNGKCDIECTHTEWGPACNKVCGHCKNNLVCSVTDGTCPESCEPGWSPPLCIECIDGKFGSDCNSACGNCKNNSACNKDDGVCTEGCQPGYKAKFCVDVCENGTYGYNCSEACGNCFGPVACDHINGYCAQGCEAGYTGSLCNVCENGKYGNNCSETCGNCLGSVTCNHVTGFCIQGCEAGYTGSLCKDVCENGKYGNNCSETCGNCLGSVTCNHITGVCTQGCEAGYTGSLCKDVCENGKYGNNCSETCGNCLGSVTCNHVTGFCIQGCEAGYTGSLCKDVCENGKYGNNCSETCGNCLGSVTCNHITGVCTQGCEAGYTGSLCKDVCRNRTYGVNCTNDCGYCLYNAKCDHINGLCENGCQAGWRGSVCLDACDSGAFGHNCSGTCGKCLAPTKCNHENGHCVDGCEAGYEGDLCKKFATTAHTVLVVIKCVEIVLKMNIVIIQQGHVHLDA